MNWSQVLHSAWPLNELISRTLSEWAPSPVSPKTKRMGRGRRGLPRMGPLYKTATRQLQDNSLDNSLDNPLDNSFYLAFRAIALKEDKLLVTAQIVPLTLEWKGRENKEFA